MKNNYVVTITRQFGSLGRPIAHQLSEKLGIEYYDRDIVETTAKRMNQRVSVISDAEEAAKSSFFKMRFPLGTEESRIQDEIFDVQQKIITELADKESCIIVGRCSDYVLRNYKNVIHIYIYAPYEARINNCVDYLHMTREDAIKEMTTVDKARCAYHEKYAGHAPDDFNHKNYMIDSSVLGVDGTAEILADIVRKKFCI